VFYAGLRDVSTRRLVYAITGIFFVQVVELALARGASEPDFNAHTRRLLPKDADDVIVVAKREGSGRLTRCIPVGEYRSNAYRLRKDILTAWGGISSRDGYIQRSAVFPVFLTPAQFLRWWRLQQPAVTRKNFLHSKMATCELPAEPVHPTEDALADD